MTVTATPQPVDAGAPVREVADRPEPPLLVPRRRPGYLGPVHIVQLLLVEVAVVVVLATLDSGPATVAGAAVAGVLLLLLVLTRRGGRWWLERRLMTRRYRRRRLASAVLDGGDARVAQLRQFAPGLVVENVSATDGAQVGVARDDAGWYGVVALAPSTPDNPSGLQLDTLTAGLVEAEQPGAVLQVVIHTVPAPSVETAAASPAGYSYRQLLAKFGAMPMPADQVTWIAVRLDARAVAEAATDGVADVAAAPRVVAALARKVTKSLRHAGVAHRVLNADALLDALVRACDLEHAAHDPRPAPAREEWSQWRSTRLTHRSFWVRDWPSIEEAGKWLASVSAAGAVTTVAVTLAPETGDGTADLRALLRVAAPHDSLTQACQAIQRLAEQARADLFPLDGEQGPAVYASAPTGGGAR